MKKIGYYIKAIRWLWANRSWSSSRQKWKALERHMKENSQ